MESAMRLDAFDGKKIYARHRDVAGAPIVVILHGMTAHMDGRLEMTLARRLESEGYASLRFNAYDWADDGRNLCEMGLREHLEDLETVLQWAQGRGVPVAVVGHSFGGLCVLLRGGQNLAGAVLWDPASQRVWSAMNRAAATFDPDRREYVQRSRVGVVYSERIMDEMEQADAEASAGKFSAPLLILGSPQWPHIAEAGERYAALAPHAEWKQIENADHNFTDDLSERSLMDLTVAWLRQNVPV